MADQTQFGAYVPTTAIYDNEAIHRLDISEELKDLLTRLHQRTNNIALNLNLKDTGYYPQVEFINGQLFFPDPTLTSRTQQLPEYRQVFRTVINFGALPNTGTTNVAHNIPNINNLFSFTRIYGAATDPVALSYLPLPYASPVLANNIEVNVNNTNVTITTGSNRAAYTTSYVILEYLKN